MKKLNYKLKKAEIIAEAIDYQTNAEDCSYAELYEITDYFTKMAKRYGLIKEFRENGIIA